EGERDGGRCCVLVSSCLSSLSLFPLVSFPLGRSFSLCLLSSSSSLTLLSFFFFSSFFLFFLFQSLGRRGKRQRKQSRTPTLSRKRWPNCPPVRKQEEEEEKKKKKEKRRRGEKMGSFLL